MLKQLPGLMGRANRTPGFRSLLVPSGVSSSLQLSGGFHTYRTMSNAISTIKGTKLGTVYQLMGTSVDLGGRNYTGGSVRNGAPPSSLQVALSNELMEEEAGDQLDSELEVMQKEIEKTFTIEETMGSGVVT